MLRYIVLLNFTEKGIAEIKESTSRVSAFQSAAAKAGAKVESIFWTVGQYDGVMILSAPDETTAAALVLQLGTKNTVRSSMLRAFDESEFNEVIAKMS